MVAASDEVKEPVREIANECGIDYDEEDTSVIDHLRFDSSDSGDHTLVLADNFVQSPVVGQHHTNITHLVHLIGIQTFSSWS